MGHVAAQFLPEHSRVFCLGSHQAGAGFGAASQQKVEEIRYLMSAVFMPIKISKTKFMAGVQCLKRLYLLVHEPDLEPQADDANEATIEQGREVGLLARQLFPGAIEVDGSGGLEAAIRTTRELVANPEVPAIFEGAFEHKGVIVKTDILQRRKENHWRLVEVKSTTDLKDHHLEDVAIQKYVLSGSGVDLASVWLAHINRDYVLSGETVDAHQFFLFRNLTSRANNLQPELVFRLRSQFRILALPTPPEALTGPHCIDPVVCEFFSHCNQPLPQDHIGYLPRLHASAAEQLREMGVESIHDIPADFELSEFQRRVCRAMQTGQPWFSPALKTELEALKYPFYFMDFETVNPGNSCATAHDTCLAHYAGEIHINAEALPASIR
jgi:hypothetical protein